MASLTHISVGRDMRSVILMQDGDVVSDLMITSFGSGQLENGEWAGLISLHRTCSDLERKFAKDAVFWIYATVHEKDGSRTQYLYPEATIQFRDAGTWSASFSSGVVCQDIAFNCKIRQLLTV